MTRTPSFGRTRDGRAVHAHTRSYASSMRLTFRGVGQLVKEAEGFNAKLAVLITEGVGTMACAYLFALIALVSLPEVMIQANVLPPSDVPHLLNNQGLILLVAWVAQTFLQLVLLSIILVGQRVQSTASDARAAKTFEDVETVLDRLDENTAGGLQVVLERVDVVGKAVADLHGKVDQAGGAQ